MTRSLRLARLHRLVLAAALGGQAACVTPGNPHFDASRPHHRPGGFQNNHLEFMPKGMLTVAQWQWDAWRNGLPRAPRTPTPTVTPDVAFVQANAGAGPAMVPAITWVGHSTMLVQIGGLNLLTDPVFSERASPVGFTGPVRMQPPGLAVAQLPRIDLVLVSHDHYDHLDEGSVRALNAQVGGPPLFIVPLGLKPWLAGVGITRAVELDWWQSHTVDAAAGAVDIVLTPAQHWSGRTLTDRLATLWGGFAVFAPDFHFFYSGDTGYSPDFKEIGRRFAARQPAGGFDLAMLPIGAYEPRWFMRDQHVDPAEAVHIHRDVRARQSVGVHWGTFHLTDESLDEPPRALERARAGQGLAPDDFFVLAIGQTRTLPRRARP